MMGLFPLGWIGVWINGSLLYTLNTSILSLSAFYNDVTNRNRNRNRPSSLMKDISRPRILSLNCGIRQKYYLQAGVIGWCTAQWLNFLGGHWPLSQKLQRTTTDSKTVSRARCVKTWSNIYLRSPAHSVGTFCLVPGLMLPIKSVSIVVPNGCVRSAIVRNNRKDSCCCSKSVQCSRV